MSIAQAEPKSIHRPLAPDATNPPGKETPNVQVSTGDSKDLTEYEASPTQNIMRDPMKSVHTLCCFDSGDELKFAQMLDEANDVALWL